MEKLSMHLFAPGMTTLHRVGLAGLYMTLKHFEENGITFQNGNWKLDETRIEISWNGKGKDFLDALFKKSFGIKNGFVNFSAHSHIPIGDIEYFTYNNLIMSSFLQHPTVGKREKNIINISFNIENEQVVKSFKPIKAYSHINAAKNFFSRDKLKTHIEIKSWAFPGGTRRHETHKNTVLSDTPERYLCLLFAPIASLYYKLYHKTSDGKTDKSRLTAIILPHITNLREYFNSYRNYLDSPVNNLYAEDMGDAGLIALTTLKADEDITELGAEGCTVITMGKVGWNRQISRTGVFNISSINEKILEQFEKVLKCLPNKIIITSPKQKKKRSKAENTERQFYVIPSPARGLAASNIADRQLWYKDFHKLMKTKKQAKIISYERGGLNAMVRETEWLYEEDRKFIEAIHDAMRNRYGAIAEQATKSGENLSKKFSREYERWRTGLMRAKNQQTLRSEIADLFARGKINRTLKKDWVSILPLFDGKDWQKTRDLALLALASYSGKGAEEIEADNTDESEENQQEV